jgi:hypothetical protein
MLKKLEIKAVGDPPRWLRETTLSANVGTNCTDKRRSLGRYSSLAESGHEGLFCFFSFLTHDVTYSYLALSNLIYTYRFCILTVVETLFHMVLNTDPDLKVSSILEPLLA